MCAESCAQRIMGTSDVTRCFRLLTGGRFQGVPIIFAEKSNVWVQNCKIASVTSVASCDGCISVALIFVTWKLSAQGVTQSVVTIRTEVSYVLIFLEIYHTQKSVCKATKTLRKHHLVTLNVNIQRAGLSPFYIGCEEAVVRLWGGSVSG